MPECPVFQLTDALSPIVTGANPVRIACAEKTPLLRMRLRLYASCQGEWLHADTDVSIRNNVRGVFDDKEFDVALCDRNWSHLPQSEHTMQTMPFNTGVVFVRHPSFWTDVLTVWETFPEAAQDWMSEQRAVYEVVRSGRYRVKILPGMAYNYPPRKDVEVPFVAALVHYKGPRKDFLTEHAMKVCAS